MKDTDPASEIFGAKSKVLKELVTHHAKEEEREMFPAAKKVLSDQELEQLTRKTTATSEVAVVTSMGALGIFRARQFCSLISVAVSEPSAFPLVFT